MPRRLLAVAVAGALALAGLAGCREVPTVAAYVGDAQLTNKQVEDMLGEFDEDVRAKNAGRIREVVVSLFVVNEVARQLAKEHGIAVPATDTGQLPAFAASNHVKNGNAIRLDADEETAFTAIQHLGTPQPPTEADRREVWQNLVADGKVDPSTYNENRDKIDSPELQQALGLRVVLKDAVNRYRVSVNPRYQPLAVPVPLTVGGVDSEVLLPLDTPPSAVIDKG